MKLLLVEDDEMLGRATMNALQRESLRVDWVRNGMDAKIAARSHEYDAILLDLGLPDMAGEQFLQQLRGLKNNTPVIVLTARDQMRDRVNALDLGADDYLVKPVDLEEVTARVRAITRRAQQARLGDGSVLSHGELRLQPARRAAVWKGTLVPLTNREFWLLETLVRKKGQIVSRERLEEALYGWGDEIDSNTVEVYIHHLRRKLGPGLIRTVRGLGYHLAEADSEVSGVHGA